jgi:hypothetical protein
MNSRFSRWAAAALLGVSLSLPVFAADSATNAPANPPKKKAKGTPTGQGAYPFHGMVASVDAKGATFTLEGKDKPRVIAITSESRFEKDGKPATFSDVAAGDYAHGRVEKKNNGEVLVKGAFGPKPVKKKKTAE